MAAPGGHEAQTAAPGIRVLLVDDHRVLADVLSSTLARQPDVARVDTAYSLTEALVRVAAADFDVVVVDLDLPDGGGLELVEEVGGRARVVVLTAHTRADLADRAMAAGAVAFLGKDGRLERLLAALREATTAQPMVDCPTPPRHEALTHRELEVLRLLGLGHDAGAISDALAISLHTTRHHIKRVIGKLGAHSQLGAVVVGQRRGLIRVGSRY